MNIKHAKPGMLVRISKDITKTKHRFSLTTEMKRIAGDRNLYPIIMVDTEGWKEGIHVKGFLWHPDDLIWDDDPGVEDVSLAGKKYTFDPNELI
ncbi:MAG: hypothetical protein R3267_04335 [Paenisporosarcina sp.]|nr:hypothetical protein [Paenisporosarcina sp.]